MCGIAGYVGPGRSDELVGGVRQMMASMARRGPDSEGLHQWPAVLGPGAVFGHRRLAILDLSPAGHQPMLSDDGETGVVFNGCIYNFLEIRQELETHGHRFRSHCDTEVLVRGYEQWGIDGLVPRLRGMFAFGIWDNRKRKLVLVRDRLGVKPLVYVASGRNIAFASTVTALRDADLADSINPEAILEFLEFDWVTDGRSIFSGVCKVPAAAIVEWQDGKLTERTYWTLPEASTHNISFDEAVEQTEALLLEAVKLRLISDVPAGALLSGGVDSALICWAMAKAGADVKSFTVGTPGDPQDETAGARLTAQRIGIPHEVIALPSGDVPALDDLTCAYGEPFACGSALAMLRVCKAVKPKATVLLTGDGGDDVFLGYPHHRRFLLAQRAAQFMPQPLASAWPALKPVVEGAGPLRRAWRFIDYATGGIGAATDAHDGLPYLERSGMLGERLSGVGLSHRQMARSLQSARALLPQFLDYERRNRFVAEFMTKVDGGAMHYAIEARSPFLDQRIWEFAASLPFELRMRGGELKAILRAIVRKRIGEDVASRGKQGFTVPIVRWLASAWKPQLEAIADDSVLEREGWIQAGALRRALQAEAASQTMPRQMWRLLVLERWARKNMRRDVPAPCEPVLN